MKAEAANSTAMTTPTEWDEVMTPAGDIVTGTLAMITGHGYDALPNRAIACLVKGCQHRFATDHHLCEHLEMTHGWQIDDINDRITERNALAGGDFWVGGAENMDDPYDEQEEILRRSLTAALARPQIERNKGGETERKAESGVDAFMEGMMIDPALMDVDMDMS